MNFEIFIAVLILLLIVLVYAIFVFVKVQFEFERACNKGIENSLDRLWDRVNEISNSKCLPTMATYGEPSKGEDTTKLLYTCSICGHKTTRPLYNDRMINVIFCEDCAPPNSKEVL